MEQNERGWIRGVVSLGILAVLAAATLAAPVEAASSKKQVKRIAKRTVKALTYTKGVADSRFLDTTEGQAKILWAQVAASGTILAQSGGITLVNDSTPGFYYLNFPAATQGKAIVATGTWQGVEGGGVGGGGIAHVNACGGPPLGIPCDFGNTPSGVLVEMEDPGGSNMDFDFYVAVIP